MDASSMCSGLIIWLETFPGVSGVTVESLADGVVVGRVLNIIDPIHFSDTVARLKDNCGANWRLKVSNLRKIQQSMEEYLQNLNVQYSVQTLPDLNKIGEKSCPQEIGRLLQLVLGCAMNCHYKERYIQSMMGLSAEVQAVAMDTLQTVFMRDPSPGADNTNASLLGPASFHPNQRTIAEQLETTTRARDEAVTRVLELEIQLSELSEERIHLSEENARLQERLGGLEEGTDPAAPSTGTASRYKDLKKKIDSLQDDLFKVETSRDEYRSRVEELQRQHAEMVQRTEELQRLADQAHTLQDEVDVLRDMGQRATQAESTIESYKKKLDELSDLRRQNKMLEEKNADYMQHILELEEDVKKTDSWRPQLELFKKQVAELRQQLAEETKKADRLAFDNKKLGERVEAITVEKDRVALERDGLKEHVEDLRCQSSAALSPDGRGGADLPRSHLLPSDPQDVWEKLMRLQHENQQLKKQQREGPQSEPVLQAMLSDLQERHDNMATENRWARDGPCEEALLRRSSPSPTLSSHRLSCSSLHYTNTSPLPPVPSSSEHLHRLSSTSSSSFISPASSSLAFFDAYINLDAPRKLKLLRKNLKWASESDLLILRQPSLFSSVFASTFSASRGKNYSPSPPNGLDCKKSLTLPMGGASSKPTSASSLSRRRPYSDGAQHIIIRHIHEFKLPPPPPHSSTSSGPCSTEDSGCCRTSPSSCDGCDDGAGTLDSGVSGLYDCVTPVIPAIAETCSARHFSDVFLSSSSQAPTSLTSNCSSSSSSSWCPVQPPIVPVLQHTHCCSPPPVLSHRHSATSRYRSPARHSECHGEHLPVSSLPRAQGEIFLRSARHGNESSSIGGRSDAGVCDDDVVGSLSSFDAGSSRVVSFSKSQDASDASPTSSPSRRHHHRSLLPPDSPTPHNSPRIPSRVTGARNGSGRQSLSSTPSSCSSMSESEPRSSDRRHCHILQRSQSEDCEKSKMRDLLQRISSVERNCVSTSNESLQNLRSASIPESDSTTKKLEQINNAYNGKKFLDEQNSNLIKCHASFSADHLPVSKTEELKICKSYNGLEVSPVNARSIHFVGPNVKPVSVVRGVASAIRPFKVSNSDTAATNNNVVSNPVNNNRASLRLHPVFERQNHVTLDKNVLQSAQDDKKAEVSVIGFLPKSSSPILVSRKESSTQCNSDSTSFERSLNTGTIDTSNEDREALNKSGAPILPSKGSFNMETHFGMHDISEDGEPVTVLRPTDKTPLRTQNHVTFKSPLAVRIEHSNSRSSTPVDCKSSNISKVPFTRSASVRVGKSSVLKSKSDVPALTTDTLFCHMLVSTNRDQGKQPLPEAMQTLKHFRHQPLIHNASDSSLNKKIPNFLLCEDSDADEDLLEHKLVAGAYEAPLVSSESCTSVSHDDYNDTDPSATEYNTDNGSDTCDFTPYMFKLNYDELLQKDRPQVEKQHQLLLSQHSLPAKHSLSHRNSLSRIQEEDLMSPKAQARVMSHTTINKIKKHNKLVKSNSLVGVKKKKKHRTARMMAAETFNAMFVFCTP